MAELSIGNLDDTVEEALRSRAARNGRTVEAEIRAILTTAAAEGAPGTDLFGALTERFTQLGGVDLELPGRTTSPRTAHLPE